MRLTMTMVRETENFYVFEEPIRAATNPCYGKVAVLYLEKRKMSRCWLVGETIETIQSTRKFVEHRCNCVYCQRRGQAE